MSQFELKILASDHSFYEGDCKELVIPIFNGYFGILAHHDDITLSLVPGTTHFTLPDGSVQYVVTGTGIVSVHNNHVIILVDFAEKPEEIDEKRALAAKERAQEKLRQKQGIIEYHTTQASLARAMARLSGKHTRR